MGQAWLTVNLDKKKSEGGASIEDIIFRHDFPGPSHLDTLLRRPETKLPGMEVVFPPFAPGALYRAARDEYPAKYFPLTAPLR
jgi:hypothetical protein